MRYLIVACSCMFWVSVAYAQPEKVWATFSYDFNDGIKTDHFDSYGNESTKTATGLNLIATSEGPKMMSEILPRYVLEGDFSIEVGFTDLVHESNGHLAGAMLGVDFEDNNVSTARMRLGLTHNQQTVANYLLVGNDGTNSFQAHIQPSTLKSGRMRLVRKGDVVQFFTKETDAPDFVLISTQKATASNSVPQGIHLSAACIGKGKASVTWTDIQISAEVLYYLPSPKNVPLVPESRVDLSVINVDWVGN